MCPRFVHWFTFLPSLTPLRSLCFVLSYTNNLILTPQYGISEQEMPRALLLLLSANMFRACARDTGQMRLSALFSQHSQWREGLPPVSMLTLPPAPTDGTANTRRDTYPEQGNPLHESQTNGPTGCPQDYSYHLRGPRVHM